MNQIPRWIKDAYVQKDFVEGKWEEELEALRYDDYSHRDGDYKTCSSYYTVRGNNYNGSGKKQPCDCGADKNWNELLTLVRKVEAQAYAQGEQDMLERARKALRGSRENCMCHEKNQAQFDLLAQGKL